MTRYSDRLEGLEILKEIDSNKRDYLIIHYACSNFYVEDQSHIRITTIAVRKLSDAQTTLFAIDQMAEKKQIPIEKIPEKIDMLEKELLKRFFAFVENNNDKKWIHWNMRDNNYGFKAIEHRYEIYKGKPSVIPDSQKFDLASTFVKIYGDDYVPKSKMTNLMLINQINQRDYLEGVDEATAIENSEFKKVNMSVSTKVDLFSRFLSLATDKKLKTNATWKDIYGNTIIGKWYSLKDKRFYKPIEWLVVLIVGGLIWYFIERNLLS